MKIISERLSTCEIIIHDKLKSCLRYRTEIDVGEECPWVDTVQKSFDLDSQEFKNAVKNPEEFVKLARRATQAVFFKYMGQKLYPDIWKPPT